MSMKMLGMMRRWRGLLAAFGLLTLVALLPWGSRAERGVVGMEREVMAEQRGEGFGVESALSRGMMDAEGNAAGSVGIAEEGGGAAYRPEGGCAEALWPPGARRGAGAAYHQGARGGGGIQD